MFQNLIAKATFCSGIWYEVSFFLGVSRCLRRGVGKYVPVVAQEYLSC